MYDIIVVGGGPGGLMAGKTAAELGLKTLILEKDQEIGVPVRCGEGIGFEVLEDLGVKLKPGQYTQKIKGSTIISPSGKRVVINFGRAAGCILERKMFEKGLAEEAVNAGAKLLVKATVEDLIKENGFVRGVKVNNMGNKQEFRSKVVIGADGVESKVGRMAGMDTVNKPANVDSGIQYEMVGVKLEDPQALEFYFGNDIAPRGYIWIFPKGRNRANVGIGIGGYMEKTAKHYLDKFVQSREDLKNASIIEVNGGSIPVGGFLKNMVSNGLMLVGDAAHQVHPLHGGGMEEAMTSGAMAAKVASNAIKNGDVSEKSLDEYNKLWWKKRGNKLQKLERTREIMEKMTDNDFNTIAESINPADLLRITDGNMKLLVKVLIKSPKLAVLAGKLI